MKHSVLSGAIPTCISGCNVEHIDIESSIIEPRDGDAEDEEEHHHGPITVEEGDDEHTDSWPHVTCNI